MREKIGVLVSLMGEIGKKSAKVGWARCEWGKREWQREHHRLREEKRETMVDMRRFVRSDINKVGS